MSLLSAMREHLRVSAGQVAIIDAAKAAPPPSPLAPVDLTDSAQVTGVMEIAARIGELLISAGSANSDARAQVHLAASSYGLHYCHVDILMNTITIHTAIGTGDKRQNLHVFRVVPDVGVNFSKLSEVDRLIRDIHSGKVPPAMAEKRLDDIDRMPAPYKPSTVMLGWGGMGGLISMMLGGDLLVGLIAFVVSALIMGLNDWLANYRLPPFYQNVVGGFLAVFPAAILYNVAAAFGINMSPAQIIASGIIVLVAGLTLVQSLVDGITRSPVTSSARFFSALLSTGAIIAGVGVGIQLASAMGFDLPPMGTLAPPVYHKIPLLVLLGGTGSAAFALACGANWIEITLSGLTAAAGMVFYYFVVVPFGVGPVIASGLSAIVVGLAGGLMSRRWGIPPLITMIVGYTPMLPGLMLYRGMYASINEQMITGFTNLATALAISGALAAGVVFGERVARRLRRPKYFRPYSAFKRIGRFSFHKATNLARKAPRIPRVPMSPFAPRVNRPELPPTLGPKPPQQAPTQQHAPGTTPAKDLWPAGSQWPAQPQDAERTTYTVPGQKSPTPEESGSAKPGGEEPEEP